MRCILETPQPPAIVGQARQRRNRPPASNAAFTITAPVHGLDIEGADHRGDLAIERRCISACSRISALLPCFARQGVTFTLVERRKLAPIRRANCSSFIAQRGQYAIAVRFAAKVQVICVDQTEIIIYLLNA
ncbi:hypothetical protein M8494_22525 [Serratia ureilytica]